MRDRIIDKIVITGSVTISVIGVILILIGLLIIK